MTANRAQRRKEKQPAPKLKLDFGCGKNPREGFLGVDRLDFGQKYVLDLGVKLWPWADESVEEAHSSHFVEHLTAAERIHFVNEAYRVLVPGGTIQIIVPHWNSHRAYGDLTHQWPPVSEMWFAYLNKVWREANAPHNTEYKCNFDSTWGYSLRQDLIARNEEYRNHAISNFKDAAQDTIATLKKS